MYGLQLHFFHTSLVNASHPKLSEYHGFVNSVCNSDVRAMSCCSYPRGLSTSVSRDAESPLPQHLP